MKLSEIVGYLPYGLKGQIQENIHRGWLSSGTIITLGIDSLDMLIEDKSIKPILHPLTDLTKPITVDGKEFVPIDELQVVDSFATTYCEITKTIKMFPDGTFDNVEWVFLFEFNEVVELLYQWHFDIHGLIEKGKAIDINEVEI